MLGERDRMTTTTDAKDGNFSNFMGPSAIASSSSSSMSNAMPTPSLLPYASFFHQRPLPKPTFTEISVASSKTKRQEEAVLFRNKDYRLAGGFNERVLDQRNWVEMITCLSFSSET